MRTKLLPLSLLLAGQLRTVVFFPTDDNSSASPLVIFSRSATSGSTRAIFLPTSRCSASPTFRLPSLLSFLVPSRSLLFSRDTVFLSAKLGLSVSVDVFYYQVL